MNKYRSPWPRQKTASPYIMSGSINDPQESQHSPPTAPATTADTGTSKTAAKKIDGEKMQYLAMLLRTEITATEGSVGGLSDLVQVSVFLAGVQAQVMSFTIALIQPERQHIVIAANWFGFNGLVLNIVGSILGSVRIISYKRHIRAMQRKLESMKSHYRALKRLLHATRGHNLTIDEIDIINTYDTSIKEIESRFDYHPLFDKPSSGSKEPSGDQEKPNPTTPLENRDPLQNVHPADTATIWMIFMGAMFLLLAIILQAVATQFRRIWVGCIIFFVVGFAYIMTEILEFPLRPQVQGVWKSHILAQIHEAMQGRKRSAAYQQARETTSSA